jgi:hypothetical protein
MTTTRPSNDNKVFKRQQGLQTTTENTPLDENSFYPVASCIKSLLVNVLFAL